MELIRCGSMAGQGPASSCASASMARAAGQERAGTPARSDPAQPVPLEAPAPAAVPERSGGCRSAWHHGAWEPVAEGRRERTGGWHSSGDADGTQGSSPQTRSLTPSPPSRNHLWGQLSTEGAGCQAEGAEPPGVPAEVQHHWFSGAGRLVLIHPPWGASPGWILAPVAVPWPRDASPLAVFSSNRGSGGWRGMLGRGTSAEPGTGRTLRNSLPPENSYL